MKSLWLDKTQIPSERTDQFQAGVHYDAIVVGAGLTGLVSALLLCRAGLRVCVIEARYPGAVTTGNTTAKLSLLQGSTLSSIREHATDKILEAYVTGNTEGQKWLLRYLAERGVPFEGRTAYSYVNTEEGLETLNAELEASRTAGLEVQQTVETELPFDISGAISLAHQAQFNPIEVLAELCRDIRSRDGHIVEGLRVEDLDIDDDVVVTTALGKVSADQVVLATGIPILDRGFHFARVKPSRSHALAFRKNGAQVTIPQGMYVSLDAPNRSLRTAIVAGQEYFIVGGDSYPVGRVSDTQQYIDEILAWTHDNFPGLKHSHIWAAQDYQSVTAVPFVGWLGGSDEKVSVATGYNKWGMTNAVAAALTIAKNILGGNMPWSDVLYDQNLSFTDIAESIGMNIQVAGELASGWAGAELNALDDEIPPEGAGIVGNKNLKPTAISTVNGKTCAVSAICTHLGGIVSWNGAEKTWDCPLHGSRFSAEGEILEGPATKNLDGDNHSDGD